MNDLIREVEAEAAADAERAREWLAELALCNDTLAPIEKRKKELTDNLKSFMGLAGLESFEGIDHHEQPITARFHDRKGTPTYDLVSLVKGQDGADALVEAARAGMARIDNAMLARFRKDAGAAWADRIARYEMPGTGTTALIIERPRA